MSVSRIAQKSHTISKTEGGLRHSFISHSVPSLSCVGVRYQKRVVPFNDTLAKLQDQHGPLRPPCEERWLTKPRNTLWWLIRGSLAHAKRVIRSRMKRKIRVAWEEALRKRGYDSEGQGLGGNRKRLAGQLMLVPLPESLTTPAADMRSQFDKLVTFIEQQRQTGAVQREAGRKWDASDGTRSGAWSGGDTQTNQRRVPPQHHPTGRHTNHERASVHDARGHDSSETVGKTGRKVQSRAKQASPSKDAS